MEEDKFTILNDNELDIRGVIMRPRRTGKHATIILAGALLDTAETPYIKDLSKYFLDKGMAVVRFDFTNGFGKSAGRIENVTVSQRARDLELVVQYARRRPYINENKISILAFSFGAMATLVLEGFHALVKAIVLVNTPSQLDDTAITSFSERDMTRVKLKRYFHIMREDKEVRINYTFYEDGYKLDMFRCARNLRTPVLFIVGSDDTIVNPVHSERLFERTNSRKEMIMIDGLSHEVGKKQIPILFDKTIDFIRRMKAV